MTPVRIGTRGSLLARTQAQHVAGLLGAAGAHAELVVIAVSGDAPRSDGAAAGGAAAGGAAAGGAAADGGLAGGGVAADGGLAGGGVADGGPADKTRWVDRIEDALREGRVDLAVHSAKDVPGEVPGDLVLLASPPRADARDALCGARSLASLAAGARVGTSSVRRASQLLALREDVELVPVAGNVDTRLRRLAEGACEALVLAAAGLGRLGRMREAGSLLEPDLFVPAPGQGTLALQARAGDERMRRLAAAIADPAATAQLAAERALVAELGAGCHTPIGAHATGAGAELTLTAFVGLPDGSAWIRDRLAGGGYSPERLGHEVARRLLAAGAGEILAGAVEMAGAIV